MSSSHAWHNPYTAELAVGSHMEPATFAGLEHDSTKRRTRREILVKKMDGLDPWESLESLIEPVYPKPGGSRLGR